LWVAARRRGREAVATIVQTSYPDRDLAFNEFSELPPNVFRNNTALQQLCAEMNENRGQ
jgi:hypothetical protein